MNEIFITDACALFADKLTPDDKIVKGSRFYFGKIALSTLTECYEDGIKKLCCASRYGELERVVKLIRQEHEENAISPAGFSFSVHNSTVGLF